MLVEQIAALAPSTGGGVIIQTLDSLASTILEACKLVTGELQGDVDVQETVRGMAQRAEERRTVLKNGMFESGKTLAEALRDPAIQQMMFENGWHPGDESYA